MNWAAEYWLEKKRWNSSTYSQVRRPAALLRITRFHTWSMTTIMPNVRSSPDRPDTSNTVNRLERSTLVCPLKPLMLPVMYGLSASARYRPSSLPHAWSSSCRSCNVGWVTPPPWLR